MHQVERQYVGLEVEALLGIARPDNVDVVPLPAFVLVRIKRSEGPALDRGLFEDVRLSSWPVLGGRADVVERIAGAACTDDRRPEHVIGWKAQRPEEPVYGHFRVHLATPVPSGAVLHLDDLWAAGATPVIGQRPASGIHEDACGRYTRGIGYDRSIVAVIPALSVGAIAPELTAHAFPLEVHVVGDERAVLPRGTRDGQRPSGTPPDRLNRQRRLIAREVRPCETRLARHGPPGGAAPFGGGDLDDAVLAGIDRRGVVVPVLDIGAQWNGAESNGQHGNAKDGAHDLSPLGNNVSLRLIGAFETSRQRLAAGMRGDLA